MEEINNTVRQPVSVIPDMEERRQIRKKYNLTALIIIINMIIFNVLGNGAIIIACMILGGGFNFEAYRAGTEILYEHELLTAVLSFTPAVLSETTSVILGIKLLKINLRRLSSNREGYGGITVVKLIILSLGMQFVLSVIVAIIDFLLSENGLSSATVDLSPTTSLPANLLTVFYACLLGPVLEELLYRGVLLQSMRKYNERFAIILSALIFGLMHQNYQQFFVTFLVGIPLAVVTIKYNSLVPSIFAHIFLNTNAMLQTYLIQYFAPELFNASEEIDIASISGSAMALMIAILLVRFALLIAALAVGIVSLVKGGNMKVPTPAGKARAIPIFATAALWWVIFAAYLFLTFIRPFMA